MGRLGSAAWPGVAKAWPRRSAARLCVQTELGGTSRDVSTTCVAIGKLYRKMREYEQAMYQLDRALKVPRTSSRALAAASTARRAPSIREYAAPQ